MAGLEVGSLTLKHSHPYTIEELHDLDTNHISEEILRLQKSIQMLTSTNATLYDSISASSHALESNQSNDEDILSEEDSKLFQETIQENEDAILAQKERIEMCIFVLKKRLGIDPTNKHYDLNPDTTAITARDVTPQATDNVQTAATANRQEQNPLSSSADESSHNQAEDEQGGMYL